MARHAFIADGDRVEKLCKTACSFTPNFTTLKSYFRKLYTVTYARLRSLFGIRNFWAFLELQKFLTTHPFLCIIFENLPHSESLKSLLSILSVSCFSTNEGVTVC
uniref:Uncharacterized protein n=1 Tax=Aggregatibacter actinomycetemcomitans TaxID=714 RepID=S4W5V5_AGGAC|nr:hypothetical protein pS23A_0011 [Aggregatibacter actinomycetemcomitans]